MGITQVRFSAVNTELSRLQASVKNHARSFLAPCLGLVTPGSSPSESETATSGAGQQLSYQA